jgi:signal transduction histidine kinase
MAEELARRAATAIDNACLYEQAQRAVRSRDEMLAIVSHDLRTPLSAIMMGAAVQLATAPATEDGRRMRQRAEVFQRAAQYMCRLINDLTDIVQIDAGRLTVERAVHDPKVLLGEVVETLKPAATERGSRLEFQAVGDLTPVNCDRDRIVQILSNLVSNAIKAGSPSITLRAEAHATEIVFAVCDTGPGISQDDVAHLFDRYWRGRTAKLQRHGLGARDRKGHHRRPRWAVLGLQPGWRWYDVLVCASTHAECAWVAEPTDLTLAPGPDVLPIRCSSEDVVINEP